MKSMTNSSSAATDQDTKHRQPTETDEQAARVSSVDTALSLASWRYLQYRQFMQRTAQPAEPENNYVKTEADAQRESGMLNGSPADEQDNKGSVVLEVAPELPKPMRRDPRQWSRDDVTSWLLWCQDEFDLPNIDTQNFSMNGKALCLLTKSDFCERAPKAGDILYNAIRLLVKEAMVDIVQAALYENKVQKQWRSISNYSEYSPGTAASLLRTVDPNVIDRNNLSWLMNGHHHSPPDQNQHPTQTSLLHNLKFSRSLFQPTDCSTVTLSPSSSSSDGHNEPSSPTNLTTVGRNGHYSVVSQHGYQDRMAVDERPTGEPNCDEEEEIELEDKHLPEDYSMGNNESDQSDNESSSASRLGYSHAYSQLHHLQQQAARGLDFRVLNSNSSITSKLLLLKNHSTTVTPVKKPGSPAHAGNGQTPQTPIPAFEKITNGRLLWDFLHQLLNDSEQRYAHCIVWKELGTGVFKITDPQGLARLWGTQKNHLNMNFDKMSRALRYYYRVNILRKVQGERHCYQFLRQPDELKFCKQRSLLKAAQAAKMAAIPNATNLSIKQAPLSPVSH